jgi:Tol biopolymer transport system component
MTVHSQYLMLCLRLLAGVLFVFGAVTAQTNSGKIIFADTLTGGLFVINADGTGQTVLTTGGSIRDSNPVYSPDGSKIAFDRNAGSGRNIVVMNADGTNPITITTSSSFSSVNMDPTWSPDGQKIAFISDRNGARRLEIFVVNVDGTGLTQLTTNVQLGADGQGPVYGNDFEPSWSPDGSKIAFSSNRVALNNIEIYSMNPDGSNQTQLANLSGNERGPTWSPDSQRIGFSAGAAIRIMNRDGSNIVSVPNSGTGPAWSPDGTRFVVQAFDPGNGFKLALYSVNIDGSNSFKITNNNFDCLAPSWAPTSSAPVPTSTISGRVLDAGATAISGATLTLIGPTLNRTVQSDASGGYAFAGLPAGNYSISISKAGYGFTPTTVNFNNLTMDQTANFAAFVAFSISGQVTGLNGNILSVNLTGSQTRSVQTQPDGNYLLDLVPAGGNYTVAINSQIWNIAPSSYTFNNLSSNQIANFNAVAATYTISGRITRLGNPLSGVTVAIENGSGFTPPTTTTDSSGQYSFTNVRAGGNYMIRPSAANYSFDPQTGGFTQLDGNKTADFVALSTNHLLFTTRYAFVGEGQCSLVFTVVRGGNSGGVGPITVQYATSDVTATAGSDYTAVSGTLNFPEGTFSQTITVPLLADQITEGPETFLLTLSNPTGQVDLADPSSITIVLTDPAPPSAIVLATQPNSDRAIALNTSNLMAEPFKLTTPINFGSDTQTRVSFFLSGVQFNACQGTTSLFFQATDSQQHSASGSVEGVFKLPGDNPYLQMSVPLPQGLVYGDLLMSFTLGNLTTNKARILTQP